MEIYLDANATTPVLPEARDAALEVMTADFGNPSSIHGTGLKARALLDTVRACARRVLGAPTGQLMFLSGATEGIHTAVLSALSALRARRDGGYPIPTLLLFGATEHKAVPEALHHWNALLGLGMDILAIPVGRNGRHDLDWLRRHAPQAGLVCTMAANNETGVISDLDGIQAALAGCSALWLVDGVQALGKLPLHLGERPIDYAPFSGHKLYAPKGIGLLYVREGAPFTPLITGGGQEGALRSGTENMPGIAAMGVVLQRLLAGGLFGPPGTLEGYRDCLVAALVQAFPGVVFNADPALSLPTTINFSVPGVPSKVLLDLFDAAQIRVSGGSACGASKARPSYVLNAMGLDAWRSDSAVRLSFGPASGAALINQACTRIRNCGDALRESCFTPAPQSHAMPVDRITRFTSEGAVCYLVADAVSRRCLVIDPLPELTQPLSQWIRCRSYTLAAVLDTHSHGDHVSSAAALWQGVPAILSGYAEHDALGWPVGASRIALGKLQLTRVPTPGHTGDSVAYVLQDEQGERVAFVGDTVMPGALGRSDFDVSEPLMYHRSLRLLESAVGRNVLLLPGHDYDDRYACTFSTEIARQPLVAAAFGDAVDPAAFAAAKSELERDIQPTAYQTMACGARVDRCLQAEPVELSADALASRAQAGQPIVLVDVRESYEHRLGHSASLGRATRRQAVPLSALLNAIPGWLKLDDDVILVLFCRSGNRSAQAARALRRLGLAQAWSLAGGVALWPQLGEEATPAGLA